MAEHDQVQRSTTNSAPVYPPREISLQEAVRTHGFIVAEVEEWKDNFPGGDENSLRSRPRDEDAQKDEHIPRLGPKNGELVLDRDILKEAPKDRPFGARMSEE